jgi:hypothetical protein
VSEQPPPGWVPPGSPAPPPPGWGSGHPPPPGWGSGYPPPQYPPQYPAYGFAPVHKPGIVALRPLGLGDLYDGAFKVIRRNPKPMLGLAALVTTAFMLLAGLIALIVAAVGGLSFTSASGSGGITTVDALSLVATYAGSLLGALAAVILNGMVVHVVAEAVLGRKATIAQAWAAARGRLLRLLGLTFVASVMTIVVLGLPALLGVLVGVQAGAGAGFAVGVPLVLLGVVGLVMLYVRAFLLAPPALMLERLGVFAALRRAWGLSRRQFWRLFGIYLLTGLMVGLVASVLGIPFTVIGAVGPLVFHDTTTGALVLIFSSYLSQVVVGTVTTPFTSAVVALQYVDQRIRKEGFDVELIARSQQPTPVS